MVEYYVLTEQNNILCIFTSMMDILAWTPPRRLNEPVELNRIREVNSVFTVQKIGVNAGIFNARL
jgi:hypothetical protein